MTTAPDRQGLRSHAVAYFAVNTGLVAIWLMTGAGSFWPAWIIVLWGVGLLLHTWEVLSRSPIIDADVDAAIRKHSTH